MNLEALRKLGLTGNEIKIYLELLKSDALTAYELGNQTGIYRVHVYDKLGQLIQKGLVTSIFKGSKKYFQATHPEKIKQYLEEKKRDIAEQEKEIEEILPELKELTKTPKEDTFVEVFKGIEGLKYFLKEIIKEKTEVLITGIDDRKYNEAIPIFMKQYFRDLRNNKITERVITTKKKGVFLFDKVSSPTTKYKFLEQKQFNPTNTFVYSNKVVIVTWGNPATAIMIKNKEIAETYRNHFEHLWKIASRNL